MNKQYYGVKFPFTNENEQGYITDLNVTTKEQIRSELLHLVLTPKGQRIRRPDFGTDLIRYIYEPNDEETWGSIENEIKTTVSKFMPYVTLDTIEVAQDQVDEFAVYVKLGFTITQGTNKIKDVIAVQI